MYRIFFHSRDIDKDRVAVSRAQEIHHIKDVLRMEINDKLKLLDETGREYAAIIERINPEKMTLRVISGSVIPALRKPSCLTIACAIPKHNRFGDLVDKLTQLGIDRIIPLETERGIVKLAGNKGENRIERWKKIAENAAKQSRRNTVPVIEPVKKIDDIFSAADRYDLKIIPTLEGNRKTLKEVLGRHKPRETLIVIGPEGDFSPQEVNNAVSHGFVPATLGLTVLRVDTAAIAAASFIRLYADD